MNVLITILTMLSISLLQFVNILMQIAMKSVRDWIRRRNDKS